MRLADNLEVISYGTGSDLETQLSYDVSGSYFDLDMSLLEPGYMYGDINYFITLQMAGESKKKCLNLELKIINYVTCSWANS